MSELLIVDPKGDRQRVLLEASQYLLGRAAAAPIQLNDPQVSRQHARIFKRGDGYWIEDLGSANGVVMHGAPIQRAQQLVAGTKIGIGPYMVTYLKVAAAPRAVFQLTGLGSSSRARFFLPRGQIEVGRVADCGIMLEHKTVSRRHAVLTVTGAGVVIEDLGSCNGTFVDGFPITRHVLEPGQRLGFGSIELLFSVHRLRGRTLHRIAWHRLAALWPKRLRPAKGGMRLAIALSLLTASWAVFMLTTLSQCDIASVQKTHPSTAVASKQVGDGLETQGDDFSGDIQKLAISRALGTCEDGLLRLAHATQHGIKRPPRTKPRDGLFHQRGGSLVPRPAQQIEQPRLVTGVPCEMLDDQGANFALTQI